MVSFFHSLENKFGRLKVFLSPDAWLFLFVLLLLIPNIVFCITEQDSVLSKITDVVLPMGLYFIICSSSRKLGRTILWMIPIMVLCAFQIVLIYLYGENIIAIDMFMNVMTTNPGEVSELLGNLKIAILTVCLLYLPCIVMAVFFVRKQRFLCAGIQRIGSFMGIGAFLLGIVLAICCYVFVPEYNMRRELFPYNVCENMVTAVMRRAEASNYHETSKDFSYKAVSQRDSTLKEVYVMVIGETARADNWEIFGYKRKTNPRLSSTHGLVGYGKTLTEINTTHKSVPMLMSYLTAETFGDGVNKAKSVFEAFNSLGYATAFISNQRRNHSYIDFYGEEAQIVNFLTDKNGPGDDVDMIKPLSHLIKNTSKKKIFVVLHAYGSHFEYNKRYASDCRAFLPDENAEATVDNRNQLINAYDNTIVATDAFLHDVIDVLDKENCISALTYVSDHGEDIFDDERNRFLHASPVPTYWQLHVPMIVWVSHEFESAYPDKVAELNKNKNKNVSSSRSFCATLIDLAGILTPYIKSSWSLASENYQEPHRVYLNDYNEAVDFGRSGLRRMDYHMFNKKHIDVR